MEKNEAYYGHATQYFGVEEHRLVGGKGDGLRLFQVRNGRGLEFTISADRGADISRLSFGGLNYGYFPVTGYAAPAYYDDQGAGWVKSNNLGFMATCGLVTAGSPSEDQGVRYGLHGDANHTPAEQVSYEMDEKEIRVHARLNHAVFFGEKLIQQRTIACSRDKNTLSVTDRIENVGDTATPLMIVYHVNFGYPLLDEDAVLEIPSASVTPRDAHAAEGLSEWMKITKPQPGFVEMCYYHQFQGEGIAKIFQPKFGKGMAIHFDPKQLDHFIEWKMVGVKEYVLGLEPANCHVDGRAKMREEGKLKFIEPGQQVTYQVAFEILEAL